jgi:hypothetical protein
VRRLSICLSSIALGGCNVIFGVDDLRFEAGSVSSSASAGGAGGGSASSSSSSSVGTGGSGGIGGGSAGGGGGAGGIGGGGGAPPVGCSDGSREYFTSLLVYPAIAGCSGAWSVKGLVSNAAMQPQCNREGGNDGAQPNGNGCSVTDLCAAGWHVCDDKLEVAMLALGGCPGATAPGLWIVRAGGPTQTTDCSGPGLNNLFGCGMGVGAVANANCTPLSRVLTHNPCNSTPPWDCGGFIATLETEEVTKSSSDGGGVMCCADP